MQAYGAAREALAEAAEQVAADLRFSFQVATATRDEAVGEHGIPAAMVKRATTPGGVPAVLSREDIATVYSFMAALHVGAEASPTE